MPTDNSRITLRKKPVRPDWARIKLHRGLNLGTRDAMLALATDMQKLNLSRRQIPDWMADRIYGFEGEILDENDQPFELDDEAIDLAFNNDGSFRWLSDFFRVTKEPPRQRAQRRIHERLKLIYLALCIEYCVEKPEKRPDSVTFFELPEGVEIRYAGEHHFILLALAGEPPAASGNLALFRHLLRGWLSARAFRRARQRHIGRAAR
jgi:hypothetical protein